MIIEVLICTHNRVALLERALDFINAAGCPSGVEIRVLVAANACSDGTVAFLRALAGGDRSSRYSVHFFEEKAPGKSRALNAAIPRLSGDIIALVDDDHRVDSSYFYAIHAAANERPDATIYCGRILPDWTGREPGWVHDLSQYAIYPLPVPHYDLGQQPLTIALDDRLPGGGNLALTRSVFERVGPFSIELGPQGHNLIGSEDLDFVRRALMVGERIAYCPEMVQYHFVEEERLTLKYLLEKGFQRSYSAALINVAPGSKVPLYLWRKLGSYALRAALSLYWPEKRFFMVRVAAALGEIRAYLR